MIPFFVYVYMFRQTPPSSVSLREDGGVPSKHVWVNKTLYHYVYVIRIFGFMNENFDEMHGINNVTIVVQCSVVSIVDTSCVFL
jgi:hypothetical protein